MRFVFGSLRWAAMRQQLPALASDIDTVSELRELYRAAEARAARLRLLSTSARDLIETDLEELDAALQVCLDRLALFLGRRSAKLLHPHEEAGMPILSPGDQKAVLACVVVEDISDLADIEDREDRDACRTLLEIMGSALDRMQRQREMQRLLDVVQEREKSLEQLVGRIFTAQEVERRRVAYDLHDGVAQSATALLRMIEGAGSGSGAGIEKPRCAELASIARDLVKELRAVIAGLRPTILDDLGLMPAIEALAQGLEQDGYEVTCDVLTDPDRLEASDETALFRVAQEAVTNIRKHAGGPCGVRIEGDLRRDARKRFLRFVDTGQGAAHGDRFGADHPEGHRIGIEGMRERMAMIGATLEWRLREEGGVLVEANLEGLGRG